MKYLLLIVMTLIGISTVQAQQTTMWTGYGQDHVSGPRSFQVNLSETEIYGDVRSQQYSGYLVYGL